MAVEKLYYHINDHLGNCRVIVNEQGEVEKAYDYYPFGKQLRVYQPGDAATFTFTGKQLDEEGDLDWYYFGARFYDPEIGRFLGIDPYSDAYPSWTPYQYGLNNPVVYFDLDGRSTVTDSSGNVINVANDEDLSVYRAHTVKGGSNELGIPLGPRSVKEKMGRTLAWNSFLINGDPKKGPVGKINFASFEAAEFITNTSLELMERYVSEGVSSLIYYMKNAGLGGKYDFKGAEPEEQYRGSQIRSGVYVSARDAGNYMAGVAARINLMPENLALRVTGAFNAAGNPELNAQGRKLMIKEFTKHIFKGSPYGELPLSSQFQKYGYNYR